MNQHPHQLNRPHIMRLDHVGIGGGADLVWRPENRNLIELLSLRITFSTDATVINRMMLPVIGPGGQADFGFPCPVLQAASRTYIYYWGRGMGSFWTNNFANWWAGPLPLGLLFEAPENFRTEIVNIQPGDTIDGYTIRYQLWQDPEMLP